MLHFHRMDLHHSRLCLFKTTRLIVRKLTIFDLDAYMTLQTDAQVFRFLGTDPMSAGEVEEDLSYQMAQYEQSDPRLWVFAVEAAESQMFIGTCALVNPGSNVVEIGYRLLPAAWGQGYGKELVNGLLDFCTNQTSLTSVVAVVDKENRASRKILDSLMTLDRECYNEELACTDRWYSLKVDT